MNDFEKAAFAFLDASRSGFVRLAADWLRHRDDPTDLLFSLSRETGQALGPWESFRFCSLLGLGEAQAVQDLAEDVLFEPLDERDKTPPIAQAFALSHAHHMTGQKGDHSEAVMKALKVRKHPEVPAPWKLSAQLALSHIAEAEFDGSALTAGLSKEGPPFFVSAFEAATLKGDDEIRAQCWRLIQRTQDEEGAVKSRREHPILRAFETLRVLGLLAFFD